MNIPQECPFDAARSRTACASGEERADVGGRCASRRRLPADGPEMARPLCEGVAVLQDGSSRPHRLHRPPPPSTADWIEALRRQRFTSQQIAQELGVWSATVSRVLRRLGLNRIAALEPTEAVRRYERERPGELIHIDIAKLGRFEQIAHRITDDRTGQSNSRGVGWEYLHLAVDDHSRLAYSEVLPDERGAAPAFASCSAPCGSSAGMASPSSAS